MATPEYPDVCRSCQRPVLFVRSAKSGRPMILDAEPKQLVVIVAGDATTGGHVVLASAQDPHAMAKVVKAYTPHHATCPQAAEWAGHTRRDPPAELPPIPREPLILSDGEARRGHAGGAR